MAFTFFFRDLHTLEQLIEQFLPYCAGRSRVRIWDAGCAMGPEPYTLAILLAEKMGNFAYKNVHILASDIDQTDTFAGIITRAAYPHDELKRIPSELFAKYFVKTSGDGDPYQLVDQVRNRLSFQKHDLLTLKPLGDEFHLIVCKNVLLHFQPHERVAVLRMFHRSLAPGGFFVCEQTQKLPDELVRDFVPIMPDAQVFRKPPF